MAPYKLFQKVFLKNVDMNVDAIKIIFISGMGEVALQSVSSEASA